MQKNIVILVTIFAICIIAGCGSSDKTSDTPKTEPVKKDEPKAQPVEPVKKDEPKTQPGEPVKKEEPVAEPAKKEEVKPPETSVNASTPYILVFGPNEKIGEQDRAKILTAVKDKWFKDKQYTVISLQDYRKNLTPYIGKTVIVVEPRYEYGEYEIMVRTGKVIDDKGDALESPVEAGQGPELEIRGQENLEFLLKEIRFAK